MFLYITIPEGQGINSFHSTFAFSPLTLHSFDYWNSVHPMDLWVLPQLVHSTWSWRKSFPYHTLAQHLCCFPVICWHQALIPLLGTNTLLHAQPAAASRTPHPSTQSGFFSYFLQYCLCGNALLCVNHPLSFRKPNSSLICYPKPSRITQTHISVLLHIFNVPWVNVTV